ncbi:MAG: hypothetical protein M3Z65_07070 [Chloroflexota bacterium]|nr:hypothetical protein [Chloroflexota bacterium]
MTHQLVTGLDEITVPPAVLRASAAPRRSFPLLAIPAMAVVVVLTLAIGAALRPANNGAAGPGAVASPTAIPTATASPARSATPTVAPTPTATATPKPTPTDIRAARALPEAEAKRQVESTALAVVNALKAKDGAKLATFAHPDKGIRFSMYPFVHVDTDQVLKAADLAGAFTDPKVRLWGISDGQGAEVRLTFANYYPKFIYDVDFAKAPQVSYNRAIGSGTVPDNSATVYPDAIMVEFHYPGFDPQYGGMDWRSLRLLFEQKNGTWFLVGIVHGQWTS